MGIARRLARMSGDELRTRGGQAFARRWHLLRYRLGFSFERPAATGSLAKTARFFFDPPEVPRLAAAMRELWPGEAERTIREAEQICRHRFDLLGYTGLDYGTEIDWHLDAVHGKRAPRRPWFEIRFLDFAEAGDHKVIWELNRHQHLVTLAKAWRLTGDDRFARELAGQWYHWRAENPYPIGINWASTLEGAFRSLSWIWVRYLLEGCGAAPEPFLSDLAGAILWHGHYIERFLSTYFSPNTHLLGEAVALFFIGVLFPQEAAAARWRRRGWEIVVREASQQVRGDGMHFEQSVYYHVYALDFFLHARILAARNGVPVPASLDATIVKMLEALAALSQAGPPPRFGDDDGGRLFQPRRNRCEHMTDPLATGAVIYQRPDFWDEACVLPEETLWLCGEEGIARLRGRGARAPLGNSGRLKASGICMLSGKASALFVDAGPQGWGRSGHGHADALSVQLVEHGRPRLIDPGTYCYISADDARERFRGTAAHNTLQVDGAHQAEPAGPFAWKAQAEVRVEIWESGEEFDLFAGSHTGYCRLPEPVVHQRWIFHLKSRFWLVRDVAAGAGRHRLDLFWHLAPDIGDPADLLLPADDPEWSQQAETGEWSPAYGRKEPCTVWRSSREAMLPAEFAMVIVPLERRGRETGRLRKLAGDGVTLYRYEAADGTHDLFFAQRAGAWRFDSRTDDARFLYCGPEPEGHRRVVRA